MKGDLIMNEVVNSGRRIRRGAEHAERTSLWHVRHIPYTVYDTLPAPEPSEDITKDDME